MLKIISPSYFSSEKSAPVHFRYICRVRKPNILLYFANYNDKITEHSVDSFPGRTNYGWNTRDRSARNPILRAEHTTRNLTEWKRNEMKVGANYHQSIAL